MTPSDLAAAIRLASEAPDGVAKLRQMVLELAVRGRLVPQDAEDEPASELLLRVRQRRSELAAGARRGRSTQVPAHASTPWPVPNGWAWAPLRDVFVKVTDGTHHSPPNGPRGAYRYVTAKDIKEDGISDRLVTYVSEEVHNDIVTRCDPSPGDILYIKDGATTGVVTVNNLSEPFSMLSSVALLKTGGIIDSWYACYAMRSPFFYDETRGKMGGVGIPRVTLRKLNEALLPVPPLAEQRRITSRAHELMQALTELQQHLDTRRDIQIAIARTLVRSAAL